MKIKMVSVCFLWVLALIPAAFAGKTELTTYYPAPYGEYTSLTVGPAFTTSANSSILSTNAGALNSTAASEIILASFGFTSVNQSHLGIHAYRDANGSDWTTTAIGLTMDVDNTQKVNNAAIWLNSSGNIGIGTTAPVAKLHVAGDLKVDGSRIIRKIMAASNATTYSATTAWALGPSFTVLTGLKAGSLVRLSYHIPMRNDSTSWGGGYIEPQVSFNGGTTWNSLGSSGYDGGVMNNVSADIGSYFNTILIDPAQAADFSVAVRFYFRAYDGTVTINGSHDINNISGTAALMAGGNGTQHYAKIIVEELY